MTHSFVLTPAASRDIDGILNYVFEHSGPNRAMQVHRRLYEALVKIGD